MSIGKLILYTSNTEAPAPEAKALIKVLSKLRLIGQPMDSEKNSFLAGERFLQLISFVGCSPNISLSPQAEDSFCHLAIKGPFNQPQLVWNENCRPPNCPACQKPISNWKEFSGISEIRCNQCGETSELSSINWGRRAGYGHMFIEINNIFPGEAQPVDELFEQLHNLTGTKWGYFFTSLNI